jgi:hypothetical protein
MFFTDLFPLREHPTPPGPSITVAMSGLLTQNQNRQL